MKKVNFTPKTDIEDYLNNEFNLEIFEDLTENEDWQGTFEPLEFLNLLYEQFEIVNANKEKPLSVVRHLFGLKLERTKLYYLLNYLNEHIYKHSGSEYEPEDKQLSICRGFIEKECDKLEAELYPDEEPETENKYDFQKVKQHIETFETVKEKILYLTEIKTDFLQNKPYWDFSFETPFDRKCELEIKKLNEVLKLEAHTTTPKAKPIFKLSDKKGAKQKPIKYGANEYALTYIFDLYAIGQQVPINRIEGSFDAKKIKQDASKFPMYDKAPDTFYRAVKSVLEYNLNKPTDLQNISKDWLNAVRNLSTNWVITEQYLKDKNLIGE